MNIDVQVYFLRECFKAVKMRVCDMGISSAFKSNTQEIENKKFSKLQKC